MHRFRLTLQFSKSINYSYTTSRFFSNDPTHFENIGPMASLLKSRSVVRLRGPDTVKFLHGLLTNDVRRLGDPIGEKTSTLATPNMSTVSEKPMYSAMLTPQGRFLYDMFLYRPSRPHEKLDRTGSGPGSDHEPFELFMDVDASVMDELLETLKKRKDFPADTAQREGHAAITILTSVMHIYSDLGKVSASDCGLADLSMKFMGYQTEREVDMARRYRLRSKVEIENVGEAFSCWQRYGGNLSGNLPSAEEPEAGALGWGGAVDRSGMSASQGNNLGWQWFKDSRLDCLGFRGIFPSNSTPPLVEADKETDEENYLLWRLEKGVAEGSTEIPKGEAVPLEYNLVGLNAISFDKGCYVGQEFIARTHHRGVIRKRLLPLKFLNDIGKEVEQKVVPASEVMDAVSGKKVGTVTTALGCRGLGLLRLDQAFKGSSTLTVRGQEDVKVEAIRPEWWPAEWLQESQDRTVA